MEVFHYYVAQFESEFIAVKLTISMGRLQYYFISNNTYYSLFFVPARATIKYKLDKFLQVYFHKTRYKKYIYILHRNLIQKLILVA